MHLLRLLTQVQLGIRLVKLRRHRAIRPDDTFLVSYPKSGNTWTRFLVANLRHPDQAIDFGSVDKLLPNSEVPEAWVGLRSPRIFKSHEPFQPNFPKVLYIVRDPRDVAVSEFHWCRKRNWIADDLPIHKFIQSFVRHGYGAYGSWAENVGSWIAARFGHPSFLLLRYEDMLRQPQQELAKVARFLGLAASPDRIATAIECSSPENMRKLETATGERSPLTRQGRKDMFFVRSATSGSWKSQLPEESISLIENECGGWMRWLGYVISCEQPKPTLFNTTRVCSSNVQAPVLAGLSADQPDFDR